MHVRTQARMHAPLTFVHYYIEHVDTFNVYTHGCMHAQTYILMHTVIVFMHQVRVHTEIMYVLDAPWMLMYMHQTRACAYIRAIRMHALDASMCQTLTHT